MNLVVSTVGMLIGFIIELPIFLAVMAGVLGYFYLNGAIPFNIAVQRIIGTSQNVSLLAIPFFIMLGTVLNYTGITRRMLNLAALVTGRFTGGLAQANVVLSTLMGGLSASNLADSAMLTKMLVPEMTRLGYGRAFSAAVTASGALITPIIPPGIALIIYGFVADVSIGKMFMAGIIPGILCACMLLITVYIVSKKRGYKPMRTQKLQRGEGLKAVRDALPAFFLIFLIIGGIRIGIFTPTEAGAIGVLFAIIIGMFVYREMKIIQLFDCLLETVRATAGVMLIIMACSALAWVFSWEQTAQTMAAVITSFTSNKYLFLAMINVIFLILGMFMEGNALLIVLIPILKPTVVALGIDPVHFGLVVILNLAIGCLTPPVGTVMLLVTGLSGTNVSDFIKECMPFYFALLISLLLITFVPAISLFLPGIL